MLPFAAWEIIVCVYLMTVPLPIQRE
jgi:hypothetical protein